jgi:hypothetical protein
MRERLTRERLRAVMRALARVAAVGGRVYIAGGATAVLFGWRESTLDVLVSGVVTPAKLHELFAAIEPELYRYPAIDPARFRRAVETIVPLQ